MKNQLAVSVIFHKCRGMTTFINDNPERALPMCDSQFWKSTHPKMLCRWLVCNGVQCYMYFILQYAYWLSQSPLYQAKHREFCTNDFAFAHKATEYVPHIFYIMGSMLSELLVHRFQLY